jgi:hypothetical protein
VSVLPRKQACHLPEDNGGIRRKNQDIAENKPGRE